MSNQLPVHSYPFLIPYPSGGNQQNPLNLLDNDPPARIKVALDFLSQMTVKVMPRAAANNISIEWSTPPKLNANEIAAQGAACSLLVKYFSGDLEADGWEDQRKKAANISMKPKKQPGTLMRCFGCAPEFTGDCHICGGRRTLMVYPGEDRYE
jgi:hypothetical protein